MADDRLVHVVDDEDAVRRSLEFALRTAGFSVEKWPDGESFLRGVDPTAPACVLLDVRIGDDPAVQVPVVVAERRLQRSRRRGDVGVVVKVVGDA